MRPAAETDTNCPGGGTRSETTPPPQHTTLLFDESPSVCSPAGPSEPRAARRPQPLSRSSHSAPNPGRRPTQSPRHLDLAITPPRILQPRHRTRQNITAAAASPNLAFGVATYAPQTAESTTTLRGPVQPWPRRRLRRHDRLRETVELPPVPLPPAGLGTCDGIAGPASLGDRRGRLQSRAAILAGSTV